MTHGTEKQEIREGVALAKKKGRKGDTTLGHLSHGDLVIPRGQVTPKMRAFMNEFFDVDRYTVGHEANSKNPNTGLPEFYDDGGWGQEGTSGWGLDGLTGIDQSGTGGYAGGYANGFDQNQGYSTEVNPGTQGDGSFGMGLNGGVSTNMGAPGGYGNFGDGSSPEALGWGSVQPDTGWSLGAFFDAIANQLGPPSQSPTSDGAGGGNGPGSDNPGGAVGGGGGLLESTLDPLAQFRRENPQFFPDQIQRPTAPQGLPPMQLGAPTAPDIPDSYADIGNYFTQKGLGNADFARNLLAPYLQGDKNVYGR